MMSYPFDCITNFILVHGSDHPPFMERAVSFYKQGLAPYILPSGRYKSHVGKTEWDFSYLNVSLNT